MTLLYRILLTTSFITLGIALGALFAEERFVCLYFCILGIVTGVPGSLLHDIYHPRIKGE